MTTPVANLKESIKATKKSAKVIRKKIKKHKKELLKEHELTKTMKKVNSGTKRLENQTIRKLLRVTKHLADGIIAVQHKLTKQDLLLEKVSEDVERQETYMLKEVKRLHGLLSMRQGRSESSMYIFGQKEIGGIDDSPFNI